MLKKQGVREKKENKMDRGGKERMGKEIRKGKEVEGKNEGEKKEGKIGKWDGDERRGRRKNRDMRKKIINSHKIKAWTLLTVMRRIIRKLKSLGKLNAKSPILHYITQTVSTRQKN